MIAAPSTTPCMSKNVISGTKSDCMAIPQLSQQWCQDQLHRLYEPPPMPRRRPESQRHRLRRSGVRCRRAWSSPGRSSPLVTVYWSWAISFHTTSVLRVDGGSGLDAGRQQSTSLKSYGTDKSAGLPGTRLSRRLRATGLYSTALRLNHSIDRALEFYDLKGAFQ